MCFLSLDLLSLTLGLLNERVGFLWTGGRILDQTCLTWRLASKLCFSLLRRWWLVAALRRSLLLILFIDSLGLLHLDLQLVFVVLGQLGVSLGGRLTLLLEARDELLHLFIDCAPLLLKHLLELALDMHSLCVALAHHLYLLVLLLYDPLQLSVPPRLLLLHLLHHGVQGGCLPLLHFLDLTSHLSLELRVRLLLDDLSDDLLLLHLLLWWLLLGGLPR